MKLKMGDTMKKIKQKHLETKCKIRAYVYRMVMFTLLPMVMPAVAFAENPNNPLAKVESGLNTLKDSFRGIIVAIGVILAFIGVIELGNGIKQKDSSGITAGLSMLIGGIVVAAAPSLLKLLGITEV